ncbi:MAG TPA: inositol monophosphatase [Alphaproteobacteria bacterium]|nr:inositol monophosphatase [Alphaproteobacteria bacterium]
MANSATINVMVGAARKAARSLVRDFGEVEQLQVSRKGPADFVTNADLRAEKILIGELQRARPAFGILAEESGLISGEDPRNRWIIDPLDGTLNFMHGLPHFAISIGLERAGEIVAGVIYNPVTDDCFVGEKGQGAFLNNRRLRVSGRRILQEAVLATGIPFHGRSGHADFLREMSQIMPQVAGVRRFGAAALDLAYVAAGRFDGFWETGLQPWDIAAGIIIVREAGGFVTECDGGADMLRSGSVLATNDGLQAPLAKLLKEATAV